MGGQCSLETWKYSDFFWHMVHWTGAKKGREWGEKCEMKTCISPPFPVASRFPSLPPLLTPATQSNWTVAHRGFLSIKFYYLSVDQFSFSASFKDKG